MRCIIMRDTSDYDFKVIVVGDAVVGKTSMLANFTGNEIPRIYIPTTESRVLKQNVIFKNRRICLKLWDLPGADKYRTLSSAEYFDAKGAIIAYSLTDTESLAHVKGWSENIDMILPETTSDNLQRVVIGLKADSSLVCASKELGDMIAKQLQCKHFTGSCNTIGGFKEMFDKLIISMYTEAVRMENEKNIINASTPLLSNHQTPVYVAPEEVEETRKPRCCLIL